MPSEWTIKLYNKLTMQEMIKHKIGLVDGLSGTSICSRMFNMSIRSFTAHCPSPNSYWKPYESGTIPSSSLGTISSVHSSHQHMNNDPERILVFRQMQFHSYKGELTTLKTDEETAHWLQGQMGNDIVCIKTFQSQIIRIYMYHAFTFDKES